MKVVTFDFIQKMNIDLVTCYQWVEEMIIEKKQALLPPKISLSSKEGSFINTMPCILNNKYAGVKVVDRYPDRNPSLDSKLLLIDNYTGEFLALMDANWITAMRTGAVAAHSIIHFAKTDFSNIGIIGLGNTARATLLILAAIMPDKNLKIKLLKYKEQEDLFCERFKEYKNLKFEYVDTYAEVIKGTDVVLSCVTYFEGDICADDCFDEGVLVVPVHTRGFTNCDLFFDKVFVDDYNHVCHFKNYEKFKSVSEVCDVMNGLREGRTNDKERILAYNIGLSIHDVNYAAHIYQMILDDAKLSELNMGEPEEKFWV